MDELEMKQNEEQKTEVVDTEVPLDKNLRLMSPTMMVVRRFFRSKLSIVGMVMVIALFFGVGYFFDGSQDTEKPNRFLEKASDFAEDARSEFTKDNPGFAGSEEI